MGWGCRVDKEMIPPEEDRLELALRASNEGIWQWRVSDHSVQYSDRVLGFLDCNSDNAPNIFTDIDRCFHENDREHFKRVLEGVLKQDGKELFGVDIRFLKDSGSISWLRIRGACVRDDEGYPLMIAGSIIDISRRKEAELALEEERHLIRMLIENIPNNVYFKDMDSRFVMANQATAEKMGLKNSAELIGKTDHDFFTAQHADKSRRDELEIMLSGHPQESTVERETWVGQEDSYVITTKIPWYDRRGNVKGTFGVTSDVSALVTTQLRLSKVAEELRIRNRIYEEELQLAHDIQRAVLDDEIPDISIQGGHQLSFATKYIPASEMAGDFYEVIPISKTEVGLLICDVMGHGVRSALIVSMLRGLLERERDSARLPEWLLYGLNDGLYRILNKSGITMFATALYMVFDLEAGRINYSSAGHPMPMLKKDGKVSFLKSDQQVVGPALGLLPETPYCGDSLSFDAFNQLYLYTDGIYEAENAHGEQFGREGVSDFIAELEDDMPVQEVIDHLTEMVGEYCGGNGYGDDVCMLGVELAGARG
ncbi:hypothetical protein Rhal01_01594 [Rubritalea halochordaticola]|uniref:PAC domain-containing protein n=2 Tax=Rubritalea halochordaticola TaxID=714537 RepID=A0ABP9UY87_9BACT